MAKCTSCGTHGLLLKTYDGLCVDCLVKRVKELESELTPEIIEICKTAKEKEKLGLEKTDLQNEIANLRQQLSEVKKQLIVAEDSVELESFSLYRPQFDFVKSEEYKTQLDVIREQQKDMIRKKIATSACTDWTVNGSKAEGRRMIEAQSKLLLRSFNNECDISVANVRFSNFDRCLDRITKSFETLNKLLETSTNVRIANKYLSLKITELHLAFEYQRKKEEEKEAAKILRAQQREDAKVAKEIEEARKAAEKEKAHYLQAISKLNAQLATCKEEDRAALLEKQSDLTNHVDDITAKLEDIDYRQSNQRAGYVYVISNIGSFGEGVYKIGMTRRLDPMERVYELGDASVPFSFDVHAMIFSEDAPKLEAALHQAFASRRVNMINNRREYFRVDLDDIKRVVRKNHDKTVEFTDIAPAEQYRESLLISSPEEKTK